MPVLLQGDTSVGKTSLITYLAKASGHICVRINNHEHTDLQEYVGTYIADPTGKLVFKEGILVDAMRKGMTCSQILPQNYKAEFSFVIKKRKFFFRILDNLG